MNKKLSNNCYTAMFKSIKSEHCINEWGSSPQSKYHIDEWAVAKIWCIGYMSLVGLIPMFFFLPLGLVPVWNLDCAISRACNEQAAVHIF